MPPLDPQALRQAFGSYMTGVTIVTARAADGTPVGFTANSFTSVSLDPPLLLVCPGTHLSSFETFRTCTHFAVSILAEGQDEISNTFASSKGTRFDAVAWTPDTNGVPLIDGAVATFSCNTHSCAPAGDHVILVGQVSAFAKSGKPGLGYGQGGYFTLAKERMAQAAPDRPTHVGAIIERDGALVVQGDAGARTLPGMTLAHNTAARSAMAAHLEAQGLTAEIGRVYSVFDDANSGEKFIFFTATLRAPSAAAQCIPLDHIPHTQWPSPAIATMMARYHRERANNQFGLYIGDSEAGDVHPDTRT
ncbi:flavin reductase family protein [Tateyamaria sp. SN3-11]|uniref:flavin reductase family protein n=1 Tax=Tateyamaria sp. SN3-11 TaxID=3092147 RepID=UPI0039E8C122